MVDAITKTISMKRVRSLDVLHYSWHEGNAYLSGNNLYPM